MAQISGQATYWDLPNYAGELMTASPEQTPFLSMCGGLSGGLQTNSCDFVMHSAYDYASATQPAITETDSLAAPTAIEAVRTQVTNTTQTFMEAVSISYEKLANGGLLSGLNIAGQKNNVPDELSWQISYILKYIAQRVEVTFLNGSYQQATNAATAAKSRGMTVATTTTKINASSGALTKSLMDQAMRTMYAGGARFEKPVIFVNAFQKQQLSNIYGFQPQSSSIGGVNIQTIITDFGNLGVVLDRHMTTSILLIADMAYCAPVFQPVPGKGNFFYETLSKTGASENGQIYGKIGLNYTAEFLHGQIYGLSTS